MLPSDETLVQRCAAGDRRAFEILYDRFAPRVFGLLVRLIGSREDAEDVLQEVMSETWARASRYDPSLGSAATWVLMLARSRGIDRIRKRRGMMTTLAAAAREAPDTAPADAPADASPRLRAALEELPAEQRLVIEMAFYRGLTRDQIADALGIPVGTVKTRIRLGIRRLSEQGEELGHNP
ncbi:MAG: sigma-70 family RNA polymerase sigma factor [Phycisphaerales bacterium]|nr:sigma-70 family RNA polymerase sigma factor [Phycisphaerales bacterium]